MFTNKIKNNNETEAVVKTASAETPKPQKLSKGLCVAIVAATALISFILGMIFINLPNSAQISDTVTVTIETLRITLPRDFSKIENTGHFTGCYGTDEVTMYVIKEDFNSNETLRTYSIDNYRFNLLHKNGLVYDDLKESDGTVYFTYDYVNPEDNTIFTFYTFTHKSNDAFWIIQFAVSKESTQQYESDIIKWAKTVSFNE